MAKIGGKDGQVGLGPFSNVTDENYEELAITVLRAKGSTKEHPKGAVLSRFESAHQPRRRAWLAYAETLSAKKAATWRELDTLTVPADWPDEFDLNASWSLRTLAPSDPLPTRPRRRELAAMLRDLLSHASLTPRRGPPSPEELAERYAARPATLSEEAKATLR